MLVRMSSPENRSLAASSSLVFFTKQSISSTETLKSLGFCQEGYYCVNKSNQWEAFFENSIQTTVLVLL